MTTLRQAFQLCAGFMMLATPVAAQTTVAGVVRDPELKRPYMGAVVELVPAATPWAAGFRTHADDNGRFIVDSVPAGQYLVGFLHPDLESLGLSQVTRRIDVSAAARRVNVDLTPPTGAELVALVCGADGVGRGALLGKVVTTDTAQRVSGGAVTVQWEQLNIAVTGVTSGPVLRTTHVLPDGRFLLCDLPTDAKLLVRATGTDSLGGRLGSSGVVELQFGYASPVLHRDLFIATAPASSAGPSATAAGSTARVAGRILSDGGRPVANAQISVADATASVRTDAAGNFRLAGVPAGTHMLDVIAIGYAPTRVLVDLQPGRETVQQITMARGAQTLDEVVVNVRIGRTDFERRREQGIGHFLSAADIERTGLQTLPTVLSSIPSLRVNGVERNGLPRITGRSGCTPSYFIDGQPMLASAFTFGTIRDIGGIEVYGSATEAPPQFAGPSNAVRNGPPAAADSSSQPRNPFQATAPQLRLDAYGRDLGAMNNNALCAVILIWTKAYVR